MCVFFSSRSWSWAKEMWQSRAMFRPRVLKRRPVIGASCAMEVYAQCLVSGMLRNAKLDGCDSFQRLDTEMVARGTANDKPDYPSV